MNGRRLTVALVVAAGLLMGSVADPIGAQEGVQRYVRYRHLGSTAYGVVRGEVVQQLSGPPYDSPSATGVEVALADVTLLAPAEPSKVIAVGLNYLSHLGGVPPSEYPGLFAKLPTSIVGPDAAIEIPPDAGNVHYEGELVVIIGKMARDVSPEEARDFIFGVTAGNDVSERDWQGDDLQWFRAKAADTFGPIGPAIVTGLDYNDLHVQTRVNGELRQSESSADLLFGVDEIVSYVSRYVTLLPGDLIFTGTPGSTQPMQPGDVVEIEVAGVGVLRNTVARKGS
ncbi:MAG TPA: fumarylacetoacetate hydrolase family protein [Acidobacteriota bacterium]|nr:fumarylacetoacetate hydrolase family protein [Acidobacteriota bacterium]